MEYQEVDSNDDEVGSDSEDQAKEKEKSEGGDNEAMDDEMEVVPPAVKIGPPKTKKNQRSTHERYPVEGPSKIPERPNTRNAAKNANAAKNTNSRKRKAKEELGTGQPPKRQKGDGDQKSGKSVSILD